MTKLCLNMIVRNEAANIERCLRSVADHIGCWVIGDTGSTDDTRKLIWDFFGSRGIPGELHCFAFETFDQARNQALDLARASPLRFDYLLLADADMELTVAEPDFARTLTAAAYQVRQDSGIVYWNTRLLRRDAPARYVGVTHEYLDVREGETPQLEGIAYIDHASGANRPGKFARDAALLSKALESETDPGLRARYTFYLANSLRDDGDREAAVSVYLRRASQGFWDQEVFLSLLNAGRLMEALGHPSDVVLAVFRAAHAACRGRSEAAHAASRLCRQLDRFAEGYELAKSALDTPMPPGGLFVEPWIYEYELLDEFAVHAYWTGHYRDCLAACDRLLREGRHPEDMRARVQSNRQFAAQKLGIDVPSQADTRAPATLDTNWSPSRPQGGTELMVEGLRRRLGATLDRVQLCVNLYDDAALDGRPLVLWLHHDINQQAVQWLDQSTKVARVERFVFVSDWQRERYLARFALPAERCLVLRNATETHAGDRQWSLRKPRKMAYASVPYRGLSVLLDAWDRLGPDDAELHVWSSHRLYGPLFDDKRYVPLFERARRMPGVTHHGIVPNEELRANLRDCDFLTYPSTFEETSCLTAIEAMAAGCRVICPDYGALPETVGRFGRIYPFTADVDEHAARFAEVLADEMECPWGGNPSLAVEQQDFVRQHYDWSVRIDEWRMLIEGLAPASSPIVAREVTLPSASRVSTILGRLRDRGFAPAGIIDVGAYQGEFSRIARQIFASAHIRMIDALPENEAALTQVCREIGDATCAIALLGEDARETVPFYVVDTELRPDLVKTGSSKFRENADFPMHARSIVQRRLDSIIEGDPTRYGMVKLDVQGAELDVLRGLGPRLADVDVILLELSLVDYNAGAPKIGDVLPALQEMGFILNEIVEEHRYRDGSLLQIDGLFTRPNSHLRPQPPFWS